MTQRPPGHRSVPDVVSRRLRNHGLDRPEFDEPSEVVAWLGAVQAQDYAAAKWALGVRARGLDDAAVERAFTRGTILRTHVMRPTWHFVTPRDIRWMLALTAPRVSALMGHYNRKLELDGRVFARSHAALERALGGGAHHTRAELAATLARAGIRAKGQRLAHLMMQAELDQVICSGPRRGAQFTYALLAERAPRARTLTREEALAELARRYFSSHGPATLRDYAWWSGLTMREAQTGIDLVRPSLVREVVGELTCWSVSSRRAARPAGPLGHLLPIYDEYLIAYKDRDLVVGPARAKPERAFEVVHYLIMGGRLVGSWRRTAQKDSTLVAVTAYRSLTRAEAGEARAATQRLGKFLGQETALSIR